MKRLPRVGAALLAAIIGTAVLAGCPQNAEPEPEPPPPELTGTVTIDGIAQVGQTLTANISYLDGTGAPSFQWQQGTTSIPEATGSTFTLRQQDESRTIRVLVTRAGYTGSVTGGPTAAVTVPLPQLTGNVTIIGTAQVGQTLTADTTELDGTGIVSFRWEVGYVHPSWATQQTYTVQQGDLGRTIRVVVTRAGFSGSVIGGPTAPVTAPELTGSVRIDGIAQVGETLTANTTNLSGTGTLSFQWQVGYTAIPNATNRTFTVRQEDLGRTIRVIVTRAGISGYVIGGPTEPVIEILETPSTRITLDNSSNPFQVSVFWDRYRQPGHLIGSVEGGQKLTVDWQTTGAQNFYPVYYVQVEGHVFNPPIGMQGDNFVYVRSGETTTVVIRPLSEFFDGPPLSDGTFLYIMNSGAGDALRLFRSNSIVTDIHGRDIVVNLGRYELFNNPRYIFGDTSDFTLRVGPLATARVFPFPADLPALLPGYFHFLVFDGTAVNLVREVPINLENASWGGTAWTASADRIAGATRINFAFDGPVSALSMDDIIVSDGTGSVKTGELSGGGMSWSLDISVTRPGNITVSINRPGIERGWVMLDVYFITVMFDLNGGTGTAPSPLAADGGSAIKVPRGGGFSRHGHFFAGWNTMPDGSGTNFDADYAFVPLGNLTLYAMWVLPDTSLAQQLAWLRDNAQNGTEYIVELVNNEAVTIAQAAMPTGRSDLTIILRGIGSMRTISHTVGGITIAYSPFFVVNNITLVLDSNISLQGRTSNAGSLLSIGNLGTLILNDGARIIDNTAGRSGGGGLRVGSGGTLVMNGGEISGNTSTTFTERVGMVPGIPGSGVNITRPGRGGGVFVASEGTFNMLGGRIFGNRAGASGTTVANSGGGVYVDAGGVFRMSGGIIYGNEAAVASLRNVILGSNPNSSAALFNAGTAQRGIFDAAGLFTSFGDLSNSNYTLYVENGILR